MNRSSRILVFALALLVPAPAAFAELRTKEVDYAAGGTALQGYLAWDDAVKGPRPGVLVVHEWWGHNANARKAAERLAQAGYVAFALDMFGKGKLATHPGDAQKFVAEALAEAGAAAARFEAARRQ